MEENFFKEQMAALYDNALMRSTEQYKRLEHQRNVSAIVDFTSNLLSLLGNSKRTSLRSQPGKRSGSFGKYKSAMKDYGGVIAGNIFGARFTPVAGLGRGYNNTDFKTF